MAGRPVCEKRLLLRLCDMRAPVHLPACLIVLRACRPVFSIAHCLQLVARKAECREIVFGLLGTRISKGKVVFFRAAFIAVAANPDLQIRIQETQSRLTRLPLETGLRL